MSLPPVFWPDLTPEEALEEWDPFRQWVAQLEGRYPDTLRLPDCWWQHNELVELLAALRDYERGCFGSHATATAPMEWQRALRDVELRVEVMLKRLRCNVPGRGHRPAVAAAAPPDGWDDFVAVDVERRRVREMSTTTV